MQFVYINKLAYPQSGGNETLKRTNERKLCVYSISLCDESKFRKISYIKLLNHRISENTPKAKEMKHPKKIQYLIK